MIKQSAVVAAVFVALEGVYALAVGQLEYQGATLIQHIPLKDVVVDQWADGTVPTWTSLVGTGQPIYSDSATLPLDPRNLLMSLFGTIDGYIVAGILTRALAAAITFAYLRVRVGASAWAAFVGALVFLSGTCLLEEGTAIGVGQAFLPAFVWLSERLRDQLDLRRVLALSGAWALFIVTNSAAYAPYLALGCVVWVALLELFRPEGPDGRALLRFGVAFGAAGAIGLALAAFVALPSAELGSLSNRGGEYPTDPFAGDSLLALFFGANELTATDLPFLGTGFFFIGVISFVPIFVALRARGRGPYVRTGLAMGAGTAVLLTIGFLAKPTLIDILPTLASVPLFRPALLIGFAAAVLVAVGLDQADWRLPVWARGLVGALLLCQAAILIGIPVEGGALLAVPLTLVGLRVLGLGSSLVFTGREPGEGRGRLKPALVVGALLAVELAVAWGVARQRTGQPYETTPEVSYLKDRTGLDARAMEILARPGWPDPLGGAVDSYSLVQNAPAYHGIPTANVYAGLVTEHYSETFKDFGDYGYRRDLFERAPNAYMTTTRFDSPLLRALGVGYLYSSSRFPAGEQGEPVVEGDGYYVYEVEDPLPRAYFSGRATTLPTDEVHEELRRIADDEAGAVRLGPEVLLEGGAGTEGSPGYTPATVVEDEGSRVEVSANAPREGFLVLSDVDLPGWTATVDGADAEIERANGFARAVRIPAGEHTVEFSYTPAKLKAGVAVSAVTAALCLLALLAGALRRRRSPGAA